jgi:serine/threonine protein kinase
MVKLVLSYSRDSIDIVENLARALHQRGIEVWYDHHLRVGDDYRKEIHEHIVTSTAVLVTWSNSACKSQWVIAEADAASQHGKLLQVKLEQCELPMPFGTIHCADLSSWKGDPFCAEISAIVNAATARIEQNGTDQPQSPADDSATEDLYEIREILHDKARIEVMRLIARGEISDVYLGRYGTRLMAIKAINAAALSSSDRTELAKETELGSFLQDPTFLRLSQIIFHKKRCFIVTDFFEGETIAQKIQQGSIFSTEDVIEILYQLSGAIAEAHARGMRYLRITPSDIFVHRDKVLDRQVSRISPINFKYLIESQRMEHEVRWRDGSGPFTAPELWREPSWTNEQLYSKPDNDTLLRSVHQKANQFALGMLAWMMLEGQMPIAIHQRGTALMKVKGFLDASESFSQCVLDSKWRGQARALADIITRMVSADPEMRWKDLKQVNLLLGGLAENHPACNLQEIVKNAYQSFCEGKPAFYTRFYSNLFRRSPRLQNLFPSDMNHQHQMLHLALGQLLNYDPEQLEPTTLSQFVDRHSRLGLIADDFTQFGEALIETFDFELRGNSENHRTIAALETLIWPGIRYLIQKCTCPNRARPSASSEMRVPAACRRDRRKSNKHEATSGFLEACRW